MGVLENALRASGGLDLWRLTRRFIVHMSITGDLCSTKCSNAKLKELVVDGSTHVQELEMTGFVRPSRVPVCGQRLATSTLYGSDSSLKPVTSDCAL